MGGSSSMTIRNSATGETRTIDPSQAHQYGISTPQQSQPNLIDQGVNLLHGIGSFFAPQSTKTVDNVLNYQTHQPSTKGDLGASIISGANATGNLAKNLFRPTQLMETGTQAALAEAAPYINKLLGSTGKFLLHPSRTVGGMLESQAAKGGEVAPELLQKYLGTAEAPNPNLLQKTGLLKTNSTKQASEIIKDLVKNSAGNSMEGFGENAAKGPNYANILSKRTDAYAQASKNFWQASTPEQAMAKNFGKALTDILHEGVPSTKKADAFLHYLHFINNSYTRGGLGAYLAEEGLKGAGGLAKNFFNDGGN